MVNRWVFITALFTSLVVLCWFSRPTLASYIDEMNFFGVRLYVCTDPRAIFDPGTAIALPGDPPEESLGLYCLGGIIYQALNGSVILLLIGLFITLLIGGVRYLTAGGDEKAIQTARKTLTFAIFGLAIAVGSVFILIVVVSNVLTPAHVVKDSHGNVIKTVYDPLRFLIPDYYCTTYGHEYSGDVNNPGGPPLDWLCPKK